MAKSGLKHIDVGAELTKTEWESEESHEFVHGTSFPSSPVERQLFYRDDEHKWYICNGTEWVWLGGGSGGGMQVHGNEYHDPDFATEATLTSHAAATAGVHWADANGIMTFPSQSGVRVYRNDSQAIQNDTWTKVLLNAVTFDVQSEFDSPNNRIVIKKNGLYLALCCIGYANTEVVADKRVSVGIQKNGGYILINHAHTGIADYFYLQALCGTFLQQNDYIELWVCHTFGATKNLRGLEAVTWLAVMKVA